MTDAAADLRAPRWQGALVVGLLAGTLGCALLLDPIAQDQAYHRFADTRPWLGVPNFADVVSNAPFLVVGLWALVRARRWAAVEARAAWCVLFAGVALVAFGSAWYHLDPDDATLVWDRLPMTVGFMALAVALLTETLDTRVQRWALLPALAAGIGSVAWWRSSGDLRLYAWVQFAPLLLVPVTLLVARPRYTRAILLLPALGFYVLAKVAEAADAIVFDWTGQMVSGHTLKHLLAALAPVVIYRMLVTRRRGGAPT